jgi:hypothetical protein
MRDAALFIEVAGGLGFPAAAALASLEWASGLLATRGLARGRYYIFRSGGGGAGQGGAGARPRLLLAFPSADAALGFAQRQRLGAAPRLLALSLAQILAALAQRPAIGAALFADEAEPAPAGLPAGLRIARAELLGRLEGFVGGISSPDEGEKLV